MAEIAETTDRTFISSVIYQRPKAALAWLERAGAVEIKPGL
jgi:hypothetical protein